MKCWHFLQSVPHYLCGKIVKNQSVFCITILHPIIWGMSNANPNHRQYQSFPSLFQVQFQQYLWKGKCMQNIIRPQATADFNKNLYKTGGPILFIVDYIYPWPWESCELPLKLTIQNEIMPGQHCNSVEEKKKKVPKNVMYCFGDIWCDLIK